VQQNSKNKFDKTRKNICPVLNKKYGRVFRLSSNVGLLTRHLEVWCTPCKFRKLAKKHLLGQLTFIGGGGSDFY
jgi:hypothetical protein